MMKTALQNNRIRNALLLLYVLAVLVFSAAARADGDIMNYPLLHRSLAAQSTKDVMGLVQVADDGTAYLQVSDDVVYQLESKNFDLASFDGRKVEVKGFEVTQQV